jgi:lipopolysaccharide export system permease protein
MKVKVPILDKFIFSQVFQATLVCLFLFIIVWIAPETLVRIIREIFIDHITLKMAFMDLVYELPKVLDKAIPVGILLGSIFTFDKLSKDSELSILRGIGLSFNRIIASVILLGIALTIVCFFVGSDLIPWASRKSGEGSYYDKNFVYIQKDKENRPKQGVIVSHFMPNQIKDLIVINFAPDDTDEVVKFSSILFADYALKFNDKWVLPEAKYYRINERGIYEKIKNVEDYPILVGEESQDVFKLMKNSSRRERTFTTTEMHNYVKLLGKRGYDDERNYFLAQYYQRFLHPLTCVLFAIIGCLLGFSPPRSQRLVGFTVAVGLIFLYYITAPFFDLLAEKGALPPLVTVLIPIVFFVITIFVIKKIRDL